MRDSRRFFGVLSSRQIHQHIAHCLALHHKLIERLWQFFALLGRSPTWIFFQGGNPLNDQQAQFINLSSQFPATRHSLRVAS